MKKSDGASHNNYIKFTYFVSEEVFRKLKVLAKKQGVRLVKAMNKACEVLHPRVQAGFVAPKVWNRDCRRQGSWYRESPHAGKYLVVSSVPLKGMDGGTKLSMCDFSPPLLPSATEMHELAGAAEYAQKKPQEWEECVDDDRLKFSMSRTALNETLGVFAPFTTESFANVFISHCANHSNFISPRFYVEEGGETCPYSIGDSFNVCSACVEFFNLVGQLHRIKYVVPCPGAVLTAELPIHRYIRVEGTGEDEVV